MTVSRRTLLKRLASVPAAVAISGEFSMNGERFGAGSKKTSRRIVDVHAHVSQSSQISWIPDWIRMDFESMLRQKRAAGIQMSIISDSSLNPTRHFELKLLEICRANSALRMWNTYIPSDTARNNFAEEMLREPEVVGAKLDLVSGPAGMVGPGLVNRYLGASPAAGFDILRDGTPLFEICAAAEKPVLCHSDLTDSAHRMSRIVEAANRHPSLKLIVCHIGLGLNYLHFAPRAHFEELAAAADARFRNVYIDTSMFSLMWSGQIEGLVGRMGSDRMLFGTDSPAKSAVGWVARVKDAELPEVDLENIFSGTSKELFRLEMDWGA